MPPGGACGDGEHFCGVLEGFWRIRDDKDDKGGIRSVFFGVSWRKLA